MSKDSNTEQKNEYKEWLEYAYGDYRCAKSLYEMRFEPYAIICFHCQQTAEKAIKTLIVYFGIRGGIPKSHDIVFLLNQIRNIVKEKRGLDIGENLSMCAYRLTKYGVLSRYPGKIDTNEECAVQSLADCEEILKWAESVISQE